MAVQTTTTYLTIQAEHDVGVTALGVAADKVDPSQDAHGQEASWQRRHLLDLTCRQLLLRFTDDDDDDDVNDLLCSNQRRTTGFPSSPASMQEEHARTSPL